MNKKIEHKENDQEWIYFEVLRNGMFGDSFWKSRVPKVSALQIEFAL